MSMNTCRLIVLLTVLFFAAPAWCDATATPAQRSAAGKRIIGTAKSETALGFKPYPGAMLQLNDSIDECADAKQERTTFVYATADAPAKVKDFYGIGPKDNNRLMRAEEGRSLEVSGGDKDRDRGTRIVIRHFPPKAAKK